MTESIEEKAEKEAKQFIEFIEEKATEPDISNLEYITLFKKYLLDELIELIISYEKDK